MSRIFKGRVILAGDVSGSAIVTRRGFNTLAVFYKSMVTNQKRAICSDQDNPDLFGKDITDKIVCLPTAIGSTSTGATWDTVVFNDMHPKAMLFSKSIDSLSAAGILLADIWVGKRVVTIDNLGASFLECVKEGQMIEVKAEGLVSVT